MVDRGGGVVEARAPCSALSPHKFTLALPRVVMNAFLFNHTHLRNMGM